MTGTDTELRRRLEDLGKADRTRLAGRTAVPADTGRAWPELRARHERSAALRRRGVMAVAVAAVLAVVIAVPALSRSLAGSHATTPAVPGHSAPSPPKTYAGAISARIPISGVVVMAGDANHAWTIQAVGSPGLAPDYQLSAIDLSSDSVSWVLGLGRQEPAMTAGAGHLWVTTGGRRPRAQILELDPAAGRPIARVHLPAGTCNGLTFGSGRLFASCSNGGANRTELWRIDPRTGHASLLAGNLPGFVSSIIATPRALWYVVNYTRIRGFANPAGHPRPLNAGFGGYQVSPGGQGLVYASGSIWALAAGEQLARIDPATGRVLRVYTYRQYDPSRLGGLDFLTAGRGWLWFLDNGYPFSGVLRVSMATGRPAGGVPVAPDSCGQQICSQVYYLAGSIWVPTAELLLRIDPARLPG